MGVKTVAIVGLGGRGHHTYAKYQHLFPERMKIVAIADIDPEKVEICKKEFNHKGDSRDNNKYYYNIIIVYTIKYFY